MNNSCDCPPQFLFRFSVSGELFGAKRNSVARFFVSRNRTGEQRCCSVPLFQCPNVRNTSNSAQNRTHTSNLDLDSIVLFCSRCQKSQLKTYCGILLPKVEDKWRQIVLLRSSFHEYFLKIETVVNEYPRLKTRWGKSYCCGAAVTNVFFEIKIVVNH